MTDLEIFLPDDPELEFFQTGDVVAYVESGGTGPRGLQGESPSVSIYNEENIAPVLGQLTIDVPDASTFIVSLVENVSAVTLTNIPPAGKTQRIALYLVQDATGGRTVTGWPVEIRWADNIVPALSPGPGSEDLIVLDVREGRIRGVLAGRWP